MADEKSGLLKAVLLMELWDEPVLNTVTRLAPIVHMDDVVMALACCEQTADGLVNPDAHVDNFVEETVPRYTSHQFKMHFRMFPDVFEALCSWIAPFMPPERTVSLEKKMLAMLWIVANKESYRSVADRFGLSKGALHRNAMCACKVIMSRQADYIKWPDRNKFPQIAEKWQEKAGMPGVIGVIDGTYIPIPGITGPTRKNYICRKGFPAMHLQVVCNRDLAFLYVHTGNVGSVHDSRAFRTWDLALYLESPEGRMNPQYHLLGDSAYPLKEYLLVPFRDNGHQTPVEVAFNRAHSATRVEVEHAIGLLKGKFRRLKYLEMFNLHDVPCVIFTACVVHNFIIMHSGVDESDIETPSDDGDSDENEAHPEEATIRSASRKRLQIADMLLHQ